MDFKELAKLYKNELLENVLPFWLNHSQDLEFGGYYTCLNKDCTTQSCGSYQE